MAAVLAAFVLYDFTFIIAFNAFIPIGVVLARVEKEAGLTLSAVLLVSVAKLAVIYRFVAVMANPYKKTRIRRVLVVCRVWHFKAFVQCIDCISHRNILTFIFQ